LVSNFAALVQRAAGATMLLVNRSPAQVKLSSPTQASVAAGETWIGDIGEAAAISLETSAGEAAAELTMGHYSVVLVGADGGVIVRDANDLQLELSAAAHTCLDEPGSAWTECVAGKTFGGLPSDEVGRAFTKLWQNYEFWHLCEVFTPSPAVRSVTLRSGHVADIVREVPLVASIRGFLNTTSCDGLMRSFGKNDLTRARVGAGGGGTSVSDARETLSKNMFVNWDVDDVLTRTAVRSFDVASELLGEKIPYEGQEPVNFLHYLPGYEYKPHTDGMADGVGRRVATTLIYCEAPSRGGATVFPVEKSKKVRFVPGVGDMLFFMYAPRPNDALHAACPVAEGPKSTLTQWYRLGVSAETPWHKFENWGEFGNPYGASRWKGDRYSTRAADEL